MNNYSKFVSFLAVLQSTAHAAAVPIIAPPGGEIPAIQVPSENRILRKGEVQHLVCFKFVTPTLDHPITMQNLQALGADGKPVIGANGQPKILNSDGVVVSGSPENSSTTFTSLPALVNFITQAYYTEARKVRYLRAFGGGTSMSHEGTSAAYPNGYGSSYDACFSGVFASVNDRDYFVGDDDHPEKTDQHHHAFRNLVGPAILGDANAALPFGGNLMVFDYQQGS